METAIIQPANFIKIESEPILQADSQPTFVVAVALTRVAVLWLGESRALAPRLLGQAVLLSGFVALGLIASPVADPDAPLFIAAGLAGVLEMGVQNSAGRLILADLAPTTIMTGNTTKIVIDLVDRQRADPEARLTARARPGRMAPAVIAFAGGAIAGGFALATVSFWCLLVPFAVLIALAASRPAGDRASAPRRFRDMAASELRAGTTAMSGRDWT